MPVWAILAQKILKELHEKARFVRVSAAGFREGHVHDITITKESPNYYVSNSYFFFLRHEWLLRSILDYWVMNHDGVDLTGIGGGGWLGLGGWLFLGGSGGGWLRLWW